MLREMVSTYAESRLASRAAEADGTSRFPAEAVAELGGLGLFGLLVPEDCGGMSATRVQCSLVVEELARADASVALTLMAHLHSTGLIAEYGSVEQKQRWLPAAATGAWLAAVGLTEPEVGTDIGAITSSARRRDGDYRLSGHKTFITNGDRADLFVVFARVEDHAGLSAFIVDGHADGLTVGPPFRKMGLRSSSTTEVWLDDVPVPVEDRLGDEGDALTVALQSVNGARMSTAAQAVGIARAAFAVALRYAQDRFQSGKPIAEHQAVQIRIADMHLGIEAARALLYQAARRVDEADGEAAAIAAIAAAAKVVCTTTASEVTSRALELVGGYGFTEDLPLSRYMRDAKGGEIYDGTNDINRLFIARQLFEKRRPVAIPRRPPSDP